jgi:hypothetical protein
LSNPVRLLIEAGLGRHRLIVFAMMTAALNGIVTASVGAWLAQTYTSHQSRRSAIQGIADLLYERRARAGLVVSALRRGAELDELRYRKRAYDDAFVEWNKRIQANLLQIREVIGVEDAAGLEDVLQNGLVPVLTEMDGCLTRGYDVRIGGQDPLPVIEGCRFQVLHQTSLDCAKGLTDELYHLTRLSFMPFSGNSRRTVAESTARARAACARVPVTARSPASGLIQDAGQGDMRTPLPSASPVPASPATTPARGP